MATILDEKATIRGAVQFHSLSEKHNLSLRQSIKNKQEKCLRLWKKVQTPNLPSLEISNVELTESIKALDGLSSIHAGRLLTVETN